MLHHTADAVDAFRENPRGPAASRRLDITPKMHDPISDRHGHIQSFQAGIFTEPDKNAASDGFVTSGRIVRFCRVNYLQKVGAADDADEIAVPQDRNALDAAVLHEPGNTGKGRIFVDRDRLGCHDVTHSPCTSFYKSVRPVIRANSHVRLQGECSTG